MSHKSYNGSGFLKFYQVLATENPCYKKNQKRTKTTHLILHSTGANNPFLKRYVHPDDGFLGENRYANGWNNPNSNTLVHAVIGKNKRGAVEAYQIAPWGMRVWGCGSGKNGNGNDFTIQVEICEDQTLGTEYAKQTYDVAVKLFAHLCKSFDIDPKNIWSHKEACAKGYASNHGDPEHWWKNRGLSMDSFRKDVQALLDNGDEDITQGENDAQGTSYVVNAQSEVDVYSEPAITQIKGAYTIIEEKNGYGRLKSGTGWIKLSDVQKL